MAATTRPWTVERHDQDDGTINYEIWAVFRGADGGTTMHRIATINDYDNENAKDDAAMIAKAVNLLSGI